MLNLSLMNRNVPRGLSRKAKQVLFSNSKIPEVRGTFFHLLPTGQIRGTWAYTLEMDVFSPAPLPGTMFTPEDHALDDTRALISYALDVELTQDTDRCHALVARSNQFEPHLLVPARFEPNNVIADEQARKATDFIERITSAADSHFLVMLRTVRAYERAHLALERGQVDLAYALLVFALECLTQAQKKPDRAEWEDFHPKQRDQLDNLFRSGAVPEPAANTIRDILRGTEHLRLNKRFTEFVTRMLPATFFCAGSVDSRKAPIRRSLLPRLLTQAYSLRSGYAHELAPLAEAIRSRADLEYCSLRDGTLVLTFRGLHRIVRNVVTVFAESRTMPLEDVAHPDVPGVEYARWSFEYWMYEYSPAPDGRDARIWLSELLNLHVAFSVRMGTPPPARPIPLSRIGKDATASIAGVKRQSRAAMIALAALCGAAELESCEMTIETLAVKVVLTGGPGDLGKATEVLKRHLNKGTPGLELPIEVEIAMMLALAAASADVGDSEAAEFWYQLAQDDAVARPEIQAALAAREPGKCELKANNVLFPHGSSGVLLHGCSE